MREFANIYLLKLLSFNVLMKNPMAVNTKVLFFITFKFLNKEMKNPKINIFILKLPSEKKQGQRLIV